MDHWIDCTSANVVIQYSQPINKGQKDKSYESDKIKQFIRHSTNLNIVKRSANTEFSVSIGKSSASNAGGRLQVHGRLYQRL